MRKLPVIFTAIALAMSSSVIAKAETWDVTGSWQECFYGGGPGQPDNVISAGEDGYWSLTGALLQSVEILSEDPLTFRTIYADGTLKLEEAGPWGFGLTVSDVELAVIHTRRPCEEDGASSPYGCFFFAVSGYGEGQIEGGAVVNCTLQAAYNYDPENFDGAPEACGDSGGMAGVLDSALVTLDWADITKFLTEGSVNTAVVGTNLPQSFSFTIRIDNLAGFGDVVFKDTIPAEFDLLDPDNILADGCTVMTYRNKGADKGKKPKLEPEFLRIIPWDDALTCEVTVAVVTDGNPGHYNKETGEFTLYEPTSCDNGTIVLNEGVEVISKEGDFGFQDENGVLLQCVEPEDG